MIQKTAKTVADVLEWIETTEHHSASVCTEPGFLVLKGYHDKLRVPRAIWRKSTKCVRPGNRFDTRMYRITATGRVHLWRARKAAKAH